MRDLRTHRDPIIFVVALSSAGVVHAKPNILVLWGDDIGITGFAESFKAFPPSFVPTTIMQQTLDSIREAQEAAQKPK